MRLDAVLLILPVKRMKLRRSFPPRQLLFLVAIFAGRLVRFTILALLTLKFGPEVVSITAMLVHKHLTALVLAVIAALGIWMVIRRIRRPNLAV